MAVEYGGQAWESAGEIELGFTSPLTPVAFPTGSGYQFLDAWWKFTSSSDQQLGLTTEYSKTIDGLEPDITLDIYTGTDLDSSVLEVSQAGTDDGTVAKLAFDFIADVEYHILVTSTNLQYATLAIANIFELDGLDGLVLGGVEGSPQGNIGGVQDQDRSTFTPHGMGG